MNKNDIINLDNLLGELYNHERKTCEFNCLNCEYGVLKGYGDSYSCSIEHVQEVLMEVTYNELH